MTTVDFEPLSVSVPLREDPPGVFRVGESRVLLELVIHAFKSGATPEAIVQSYDTLRLADVYAVVTRYLAGPSRSKTISGNATTQPRQPVRELSRYKARRASFATRYSLGRGRRDCLVIKLASDENFDGDIVRGLLRVCPELDMGEFRTPAWPDHLIRSSCAGRRAKTGFSLRTTGILCQTLRTTAFAPASPCPASFSLATACRKGKPSINSSWLCIAGTPTTVRTKSCTSRFDRVEDKHRRRHEAGNIHSDRPLVPGRRPGARHPSIT